MANKRIALLSYDFFADDVAINDSTGSSQTGLPGAGQIIHLQPNAAGDNNAWSIQVGGTVGAANNYTRVKEITPDDATSYNADITSGDIDDYKMTATPASIGSGDTINVISVNVRYAAAVAAAETPFAPRYKKAAAGTVTQGATITPNSTTWITNANAIPLIAPLIAYLDPDGAAITKATLDTSQIGMKITATNTNAAQVSTIWMMVDSTPVAATAPTFVGWKTLLGAGQI